MIELALRVGDITAKLSNEVAETNKYASRALTETNKYVAETNKYTSRALLAVSLSPHPA